MKPHEKHLSRCLIHLYPEADPTSDFLVMDRGDGPYIAEWNLAEPEPTEQDLERAFLEISREDKKVEMKQAAVDSAIEQSPDPDVRTLEDLFLLVLPALYSQSISSNQGAAPQADLSSMAANFERYYEKKSRIEAATSEEEIAAIKWEG